MNNTKFEAEKSPKQNADKLLFCFALCAVILSWNAAFAQIQGHIKQHSGTFPKDDITLTPDSSNSFDIIFDRHDESYVPQRDEGHGELLWSYFDENAIAEMVALSADGEWLAISYVLNDERLELRRAADGELMFTFPVNDAYGYTDISPDGSIIAYGAHDNIWLFNRDDGYEPFWNFQMEDLVAGPMKLSMDGRYLIATGIDPDRDTNAVWGFEIGEDEPIWTFETEADFGFGWYGISLAEEAGLVVINEKFALFVLTLDEGELIWTEPTYNSESAVVISLDGSILAIPSLSGRLRVFGRDLEGNGYNELWHYSFRDARGSWVTACAVSPDGEYIAAGTLDFFDDHAEGRLALFDTYGNGEPVWIADPVRDEISDIEFNQAGTIIAATSWGDIDQEGSDLFLHEVHSRVPFYQLVTPGSMANVAVSADGSRIAASGKGVHNRQFGRGGRVYIVQTGLLGGEVSGTITNIDGVLIAGAEVTAVDNPYTAISDDEGTYRIRVELDEEWELRLISVAARGYGRIYEEDIDVMEGDVTENVNFVLDEVDPAPVDVRATQGVRNRITIKWQPYNEGGVRFVSPPRNLVETATGNPLLLPGITPPSWSVDRDYFGATRNATTVIRDDSDDAENINIYRSPVRGGPYRLIGTVDGDEAAYLDMDRIFPRVRYYYVITAEFGDGESIYSEEVIGWVDDNFLIWEADLESMPARPELDGVISEEEWDGAVERDISDVYGYDQSDSAGSVDALIGFSDETDRLYIALKYYVAEQLTDRMGIGVYVDDNADGRWNYSAPGSEGNYWGYWIDGEPVRYYRSLSGPPYNSDPYYQFEEGGINFSDDDGYITLEMAISLGFHGPEEIAIYAPDYNIGLALFAMTRDDNGDPVFEGWWPQDMLSIVSNPDQFAQVHIPVNLIVPPEAPEDLFVERDGDDLLLTWTDPQFGIDHGELDGLAGINIYKNGDIAHISEPGQQEWVDEAIDALGWYEYSLNGFVMEGEEAFLGPLTQPVGIYGVREPEVDVISQDDSTLETYFIVDSQGEDNRFAVRYRLYDFGDTLGVYFVDFFPNSTSPIDVYIAEDENGFTGRMVGERFTATPTVSEGLYRFHFPGTEQPRIFIDPDELNEYWVVLNYLPESPGSPAVGVDRNSVDRETNKFYQAQTGWRDMEAGRIMLRLGVGAPPAETPEPDPVPLPLTFKVGQNFPNPFNRSTLIPVELPSASRLTIDVYNIEGRIFESRYKGLFDAGYQYVTFNSAQMPTGIYFLTVSAGKANSIIKVILIK